MSAKPFRKRTATLTTAQSIFHGCDLLQAPTQLTVKLVLKMAQGP